MNEHTLSNQGQWKSPVAIFYWSAPDTMKQRQNCNTLCVSEAPVSILPSIKDTRTLNDAWSFPASLEKYILYTSTGQNNSIHNVIFIFSLIFDECRFCGSAKVITCRWFASQHATERESFE